MWRLLLVPLPLAFLALALSASAQSAQPGRDAGAGPAPPPSAEDMERSRNLASARDIIRRHGALHHGGDCPALTLPDAAFFPVELDGDAGSAEFAVSYGRASCGGQGSSLFTGTGGALVQFWRLEGGRPRLLLESAMHGFIPQAPYLVTMQHGGACPGGAGPHRCRVIYRWDALGGRLETESRTFLDDGWVSHDYGRLTGTSPCPEGRSRDGCR